MLDPHPSADRVVAIAEVDRNRKRLQALRSFGVPDLEALRSLVDAADEAVPVRDAFARRHDWPERFLTIRHDMDHDVENAMRFAAWEADHGIKSTYYVLHNDWYWGADAAKPSRFVLNALDAIASLGHEIGLHNQAITVALRQRTDPLLVLDRALAALRLRGFDVVGTVAHGEPTARSLGYVNSEVFTDCPRPKLGDPDRTITWSDERTGATSQVKLHPLPLAEFGLEYEANYIGHTQYLSDTGGRWHRPFEEAAEHFGREGGFLQLLIHPVWWAFSGEEIRTLPPREAGTTPQADNGHQPPAPANAPTPNAVTGASQLPTRNTAASRGLKIIVRGDCCSRRAIDFNRDLFGGSPVQVRDEKARTDFFVDHELVGSATPDDVMSYLDVERMGKSLRHYATHQTDRSTLEVTDAGLLVMDNYADMNFAAWRHRETGWKMWVHPAFIVDKEAFERDFEKLDKLTFEESVELHQRLIETYRERNGPIPVLYLNQPVAYYKKLETERGEFRNVGPELERRVADVFAADIGDDRLEPDDMGSCGPGQTLHFTGQTYRTMIEVAMEKGLSRWIG
jgi:hypothetical protein